MALTGLEQELHEFWHGYEAAVGFKSTFSAMLAAHAGVALGEGPPSGWDPYAERVDDIARGTRVYRALRRMQTADVVVLYRLCGPRRPSDEHKALGELAPLAVLTEAARAARDELVLEASTVRSDVVGQRVTEQLARRRYQLATEFWRQVGGIRTAEAKLARARTTERRRDLERRISAGWEFLGTLLAAYRVDGVIRATIGAIESTDREVTLQDAVRARLAARDASFVAEVRREASEMRKRASDAYRAARAEELRRRPEEAPIALAGVA